MACREFMADLRLDMDRGFLMDDLEWDGTEGCW
jgi:hypothetical protein